MPGTVFLEVLTPPKKVFGGHVSDVRFSTRYRGEYGMPPLRTPWTTLVGNGLLRFMIHGQERRMTLFGGIVEVRIGRVAILARESEVVDHLDIDAIRAVNQMAQRVLLEARTELGLMNAEVALERSLVCVEAVNLNALFGGPQPPRCAKYGCDICQGC